MNHIRGDEKCKSCCCGPHRCECGGILHYAVADEVQNDDGDWEWVYHTRCDKCGAEDTYKDNGDTENLIDFSEIEGVESEP